MNSKIFNQKILFKNISDNVNSGKYEFKNGRRFFESWCELTEDSSSFEENIQLLDIANEQMIEKKKS